MPARLGILFGLVVLLVPEILLAENSDAIVDADGNTSVDVIVELTDAGKGRERPTPGHPAYYVPICAGYNPGGQLAFWNRQPPTETKIIEELANNLAGQGYLVATHDHRPSLFLVVSWGYLAPRPSGTSAWQMYINGRVPRPMVMPLHAISNTAEMLALTGGSRSLNAWAETDHGAALDEAVLAAGVPRYYTKVVAVDYADWRRHQYTELWTARLSVPYWGCYLDEALPALFKTGAPMFGRDMSAPQMIKASVIPKGRVEVGTPVVKGDQ